MSSFDSSSCLIFATMCWSKRDKFVFLFQGGLILDLFHDVVFSFDLIGLHLVLGLSHGFGIFHLTICHKDRDYCGG